MVVSIIDRILPCMVIYHSSARVIGRSGGRSVVASAAYRAAECLHDDERNFEHDYSAKQGVIHSEIMLPPRLCD